MPVILACLPGTVLAPFSSRASALYKMSLTSVDLPEPDTPVTATRQPSGNATSTPRRLCSAAHNRSEEHTSELQSPYDLVCRLLREKKNVRYRMTSHT